MPLPDPHAGLVVRYSYLWYDERRAGREGGAKDRPCAVVVTTRDDAGQTVVTVAPITHTRPAHLGAAVEIPTSTAKRLGLDEDQWWIVVSEVNRFVWPGPDLESLPGRPGEVRYGVLPPGLFDKVKTQLVQLVRSHRTRAVTRTR